MRQEKKQKRSKTELLLISTGILFILVMLVLPLVSVITNSMKEGFSFYLESLSSEYSSRRPKGNLDGNGDCSLCKYCVWNCRSLAARQIFLPGETRTGSSD